jgi:uncharacterized MAPEG superfamily protein
MNVLESTAYPMSTSRARLALEDHMMDTREWLVATVGVTAALWMPYVLDRFVKLGIMRTLGNPATSDGEAQSAWAQRAKRAHANAVENLVVFVPLAGLALQAGLGATALVTQACATYFFARLAHYAFFTAGVPVARTLAFLVGFGAQMALVVALMRAT